MRDRVFFGVRCVNSKKPSSVFVFRKLRAALGFAERINQTAWPRIEVFCLQDLTLSELREAYPLMERHFFDTVACQ